MCTHISTTFTAAGAGKASAGWFPIKQATVGYDHATQGADEHALLIDFVNYDLGMDRRVALELDLATGRELIAQLESVIAQAEESGLDVPVPLTA